MSNIRPPKMTYGVYSNRQAMDDVPETYTSFSGTDISAQILVPNEEQPLHLGELQTISYSIHRENTPVRVIGRTNVAGFVRGPRTIAGSMIFTSFSSYAFYRLAQYKQLVYQFGPNRQPMFPLADMLPPFDLILTFSNEYGRFARMKISGMVIVDEGGTYSVEDVISEQTFTWMASGIQPLTAYVPAETQYLYRGDTPRNPTNNIGFAPTAV